MRHHGKFGANCKGCLNIRNFKYIGIHNVSLKGEVEILSGKVYITKHSPYELYIDFKSFSYLLYIDEVNFKVIPKEIKELCIKKILE